MTETVVERHDLFERLAQANRVVEISAPPGSGKTTLLRSWIGAAGLAERTAWVSVHRQEEDAHRFWTSVVDALGDTGAGRTRARATPAADVAGWPTVERLLDDLGSLADPVWLVIDDLHELRSAEALSQLESVLMRAPANLRFVLATRRRQRLGLHRLRLEGELTELRATDLRFAPAEARALLDGAAVTLSEVALAQLVEHTEGWAAGLRLAALSLAGHPEPDRYAAEFSGSERTVAEYLLAEVLDRQPEPVRRLLLRTSVLDRVNGPLADALTDGVGGERILQDLEEANAFVVSLDGRRSWFRYHRLFAEMLQLELRRTAPAELPGLQAAAAAWRAEHEEPIEAGDRPLGPSPGPPEPLPESLSESEQRILRYLPTHLSAREISDELYLSVHTVKSHMYHLYAKLGTHHRAETVARARALGLLAPSPLRGLETPAGRPSARPTKLAS